MGQDSKREMKGGDHHGIVGEKGGKKRKEKEKEVRRKAASPTAVEKMCSICSPVSISETAEAGDYVRTAFVGCVAARTEHASPTAM